ncbi:hypothetical protein MZJ31_004169 [Vibrio parahaemolyticus]|uniref:TA system antitoxin ParD family protein n=1 Tax=Vibrio parahaemolyticus TaxID=670 RepID=UPI0005F259F4|nr:hypothetical protein [Vibrio parahaemolyticus]EGQ8284295.1 hypothetical protein [Vibrio parahaemolyticus]EGQ8333987.1 hypothetical protein [Vibrio parahaemolyticus]EGQ9864402.1 hypothetical protein [Vibrio parahaemolyticus]EGR2010868.1 hypothetical protein [Vibrio parahaemolyticus]EGR2037002.1 hypothetical protein [Vibrio parahaemolyticus]
MTTTVNLNSQLVASAQASANAANRSVAEQIEHWANIGKLMEENQDLPFEFVRESLVARDEVKNGDVTVYHRKTNKPYKY